MAIIRGWVPAPGPFGELQREMNRVFDAVFGKQLGSPGRIRTSYVYPPMNVWETADGYVVACEVPGLEMGDLEVFVAGDQLTVSGNRAGSIPDSATLHRRERDSGHFSRAITLPGPVDSAKTEATLAEGVLTVRIAKAEEAKPKRITVHLEG
jgi:HSP20 family protein